MDIDDPIDVDTEMQQPVIPHVFWVPPPSLAEASTGLYDLQKEGGVIVYTWKTDNPNARIEPFYNRWPPSRTSVRWCSWIAIDRGWSPYTLSLNPEDAREKFKNDIDGLQAEFQVLVGGDGQGQGLGSVRVTPEMIDALAVRYGVLGGKWMIHTDPGRIDQLWRRVARVVAFDRGYGQLKVSSRKVVEYSQESRGQEGSYEGVALDGGVPVDEKHVICVYVEDYTNKQEVDELRKALRLGAGVTWRIGFKPDAYTWLEIYRGNRWGLRPSRYHDNDDVRGETRRN
ncbi:hypothetical protein AN958_00348 [Leucoagaricus sp. SymC.cos]|nr:hypothetical protein AN958_00348 [Leucoagaricus sp. SymC.cos]